MSNELKEAVIELREQDALRITDELLARGVDPLTIVASCKEAMDVIGQRFACGEAFIPELIMAGEIMKGITAKVKPRLSRSGGGREARHRRAGHGARATSTTSARTSWAACSTSPASTWSTSASTYRWQRWSTRCARCILHVVGLTGLLTVAFDR